MNILDKSNKVRYNLHGGSGKNPEIFVYREFVETTFRGRIVV